MATLGTLRNSVASKLGLDNTASSAEQALIDQWCNEGVRAVLLRTGCTVETGEQTTTADVWEYQLDADIMQIREMWREDSSSDLLPMYRVTEQELLDLHRSTTSGDATYTRWAVVGSNLLFVWPTPSAAYTIKLTYIPKPNEMSDAAHDPSDATYGRIPVEFHKAIEYYALWQGAEYDENRSGASGERQRILYENEIATVIRPAIRKKGGRPPRARVRSWHPGSMSGRRNNDRYP